MDVELALQWRFWGLLDVKLALERRFREPWGQVGLGFGARQALKGCLQGVWDSFKVLEVK